MLNAEKIAELKAANCDAAELRKVTTKAGIVVLRTPRAGDWKRMQNECTRPERRAEATCQLVKSCIVYPSKEEFLAMLDARPGLIETLAPHVQELGGAEDDALGEAL